MKKLKYKSGYINIESAAGRARAYRAFRDSKKSQIIHQHKLKELGDLQDAYEAWRKNRTTANRKAFKEAFGKFFNYDYETKKQSSWEYGRIKSIGGTMSMSAEIRFFEKEGEYSEWSDLPKYNIIRDFNQFLATYATKKSIFDEWEIMAKFDAFVGDTDSGWTRRFMEKIGVSNDISREEFYNWLWKLKVR